MLNCSQEGPTLPQEKMNSSPSGMQNNMKHPAILTGKIRSFVLKGMPPTVKFSWYSPLSKVNRSPETAIFITASLLTFIIKLLSSSSTEIWKSKIVNRIIQYKDTLIPEASTKGETPPVKSSRWRSIFCTQTSLSVKKVKFHLDM